MIDLNDSQQVNAYWNIFLVAFSQTRATVRSQTGTNKDF